MIIATNTKIKVQPRSLNDVSGVLVWSAIPFGSESASHKARDGIIRLLHGSTIASKIAHFQNKLSQSTIGLNTWRGAAAVFFYQYNKLKEIYIFSYIYCDNARINFKPVDYPEKN